MTTLDASQSAAVQLMMAARFGLVTGPPGSGKTTTLRATLDAMDAADATYACAAPTGKAARRMEQATGRRAATIHRLLGYLGPGRWTYTELAPLEVSAVFIDESSMVDYDLARALMAGASASRLVLIGDADQLPPVGVGRMFGDLVSLSAYVPCARLTTQHRAAAESWVVRNAPHVLTGGPLELDACAGFDMVDVDVAGDIPAAVRGCIAAHGPAMVLSPQRTGPAGTEALNTALDPLLNAVHPARVPGEPTLARGDDGLPVRRGMRVIQTRNDYELDVMNGELGTVLDIDGDRGPVVVTFEDLNRVVTFARKESSALHPAYALTVHKTQGSEFPRVIVVCHSTHTHMLSRGILYTAITRAKAHVTLVGDARGIARALSTPSDTRNTTLVERIAGTLDSIEDAP